MPSNLPPVSPIGGHVLTPEYSPIGSHVLTPEYSPIWGPVYASHSPVSPTQPTSHSPRPPLRVPPSPTHDDRMAIMAFGPG